VQYWSREPTGGLCRTLADNPRSVTLVDVHPRVPAVQRGSRAGGLRLNATIPLPSITLRFPLWNARHQLFRCLYIFHQRASPRPPQWTTLHQATEASTCSLSSSVQSMQESGTTSIFVMLLMGTPVAPSPSEIGKRALLSVRIDLFARPSVRAELQ
jgi:hypothetical protein